jgi:hypothetical protein
VDALERLLAIEEIKQVKGRYFRYLDTKDWNGLKRDVFSPDVHMDMTRAMPEPVENESDGLIDGVDDVVQFMSDAVAGTRTVHHGHTPEVEITSDTTAHAIFAMDDRLRWDEDSGSPIRDFHGFGHYHDDFVKVDGRWRLRKVLLTRLGEDIETRMTSETRPTVED